MKDGIYGDWGGTSLRLWLSLGGNINDRRKGPGIRNRDVPYSERLATLISDWPELPVFLTGMAGARDGLVEAPYVECPADHDTWRSKLIQTGERINIAPGLACTNRFGLPDIMRGEETQLFGFLSSHLGQGKGKRIVIMPGTHSKWVATDGDNITGFTTLPTGEIYELVRTHSLLVGDARTSSAEGFSDGVNHMRRIGAANLLSSLFGARSAQIRQDKAADWAAGFVSGLLIGAELDQMLQTNDDLVLIGDTNLCDLYATALEHWDCRPLIIDGETAVLAGLSLLGESA